MALDPDSLFSISRLRDSWSADPAHQIAPPAERVASELQQRLEEALERELGPRFSIVGPLLQEVQTRLEELFPGTGEGLPGEMFTERSAPLHAVLDQLEDLIEALRLSG